MEGNISAVEIIREISGEINGGGGGQPFLPLQEERILKACNVLSKKQLNS